MAAPKQQPNSQQHAADAAGRRFGCSECVCIAIESHRPELLRKLLSRRDVLYRDMYWAKVPHSPDPLLDMRRNLSRLDIRAADSEYFPLLHRIDPSDRLLKVGSANCGHERFDVELREPLRFDVAYSGRILVSLPTVARWHTWFNHNAEQMLRDSGKFDYSEPQLFHIYRKLRPVEDDESDSDRTDSQDESDDYYFAPILCCAFETRAAANVVFDFPIGTTRETFAPTSNPTDLVTVWGRCRTLSCEFHKHFGALSALFERLVGNCYQDFGSASLFVEDVKTQLESGADLNRFMPQTQSVFHYPYRRFSPVRSNEFSSVLIFLAGLLRRIYSEEEALEFNELVLFVLRHGLSAFIGYYTDTRQHVASTSERRRLNFLLLLFTCVPKSMWPVSRGIAAQLLSLGYGRRELHPPGLPLLDANLDATRKAIEDQMSQTAGSNAATCELKSLVQRFDAGPLSLLELSRVAARRAVGGVDFAARVRSQAFRARLPPALYRYVSDPTELMMNTAELNRLLAQSPNTCSIQ